MASKNQQDGTDTQEREPYKLLYPVDELRVRKHITGAVFCGVCAQEGWRPGKAVTEAEFDRAMTRFLKGGGGNA